MEALNEDGTTSGRQRQEVNQDSLHTHSQDRAVPESLGIGFGIHSLSQGVCVIPGLNSVTLWVMSQSAAPKNTRLQKRLARLRDSLGENDVEWVFLEMSKEGSEPF